MHDGSLAAETLSHEHCERGASGLQSEGCSDIAAVVAAAVAAASVDVDAPAAAASSGGRREFKAVG